MLLPWIPSALNYFSTPLNRVRRLVAEEQKQEDGEGEREKEEVWVQVRRGLPGLCHSQRPAPPHRPVPEA